MWKNEKAFGLDAAALAVARDIAAKDTRIIRCAKEALNGIDLQDVKIRRLRGYGPHVTEAQAAAGEMAGRRDELLGVLASTPGLEEGPRRKASAFLDEGLAAFANPAALERIAKSFTHIALADIAMF